MAVRRGDLRASPEGGERKAIRAAYMTVALAALVSGILTVTGRSTVADPSSAAATVTLTAFEFSPTELSVSGGSAVLVRNDDPFLHTFTVDDLAIDEAITLGSEGSSRSCEARHVHPLLQAAHIDPERPDPDGHGRHLAGHLTAVDTGLGPWSCTTSASPCTTSTTGCAGSAISSGYGRWVTFETADAFALPG